MISFWFAYLGFEKAQTQSKFRDFTKYLTNVKVEKQTIDKDNTTTHKQFSVLNFVSFKFVKYFAQNS